MCDSTSRGFLSLHHNLSLDFNLGQKVFDCDRKYITKISNVRQYRAGRGASPILRCKLRLQSFYPAKSFCYITPGNCEMLIDLQTLLVLDNGSQYSHLITRRLRELDVYSEMLPCTTKLADLPFKPKGIILSGGKICPTPYYYIAFSLSQWANVNIQQDHSVFTIPLHPVSLMQKLHFDSMTLCWF